MSAADDEIRATYEGLLVDTVVEELDRLKAENARLVRQRDRLRTLMGEAVDDFHGVHVLFSASFLEEADLAPRASAALKGSDK